MKPILLRIAVFAVMSTASLAGFAATSTFDADAEGWVAYGDSQGPLVWLATGGNPGGQVQISDQATGGVTYFVAPAKFLGDQHAATGTLLTFDLQQVYSGSPSQFNDADVVLKGAGLTLVYDTSTNPANGAWTSYAVPLSAAAWRLDALGGAAPSGAQFSSVLSNLTGLAIRAEYRTGTDVGHLDNVALVPEPGTVVMLLAGLGVVGSAARRRIR